MAAGQFLRDGRKNRNIDARRINGIAHVEPGGLTELVKGVRHMVRIDFIDGQVALCLVRLNLSFVKGEASGGEKSLYTQYLG